MLRDIPLQLILADGSTYSYPGKIVFADRQVNTQTGTIQIVGRIPESQEFVAARPVRAHSRVDRISGKSIVGAAGGSKSAARHLPSYSHRLR